MTSIIEFRSINPMRDGHALTELPDGEQPGFRIASGRDGDGGLGWYLARVAGRREGAVETALKEAETAVYLPRIVRWRRKGPDRERVEQALFGGYLFVGIDPGRKTLGDIEAVDMVYQVVRFTRAADPPPLRFSIIEAILRQELGGEFDRTRNARRNDPAEGEPVQITGGMFQGFPATFLRRDDTDRVQVLLKMLGSEAKHTLDPEQVAGFAEVAA